MYKIVKLWNEGWKVKEIAKEIGWTEHDVWQFILNHASAN